MEKQHMPVDLVKSYLLGEIDDDSAAALEEKYFADSAFLARMKMIEQALIGEYLDGHLNKASTVRFEEPSGVDAT